MLKIIWTERRKPTTCSDSVMRNRFYNVNISKITSIGYPDDEDVTVDPTDPINQKTYMQAHITVEPWTKVEQDAELGM